MMTYLCFIQNVPITFDVQSMNYIIGAGCFIFMNDVAIIKLSKLFNR